MTKAGFGDHLKREREMRGVTLDEICAATRIGNRFLEALESEEWDRLPGGVFNRGFVRAVARFLGLDEEAFVAEYVLATSERTTTVERSKPEQPLLPQAASNGLRWAGVVLGLVLIAAGAWGWRSYATRRAERQATSASPTDPTGAGLSSAAGAPSSNDPRAQTPSPSGGPPANSSPKASAALSQDNMLQLKIEAGKGTSLTVSADGARVFDGSMIAGQSREFAAQVAFRVQARDAGALLLELNGQALAPIGPPGRSGEVVLTRADLKTGGGSH
jgi:cytoskeleton protein RodZ